MAAGDVVVTNTTNRSFKSFSRSTTTSYIAPNLSTTEFQTNIPFSWSCWYKTSKVDAVNSYPIIAKSQTLADHRCAILSLVTSNKLGFNISIDGMGGGSVRLAGSPDVTINDNQWHHVVGVWDGSNITAYTDTIAGTSTAATQVHNNTTDFYFLRTIGFVSQGYGFGEIADIKLYQTALTTTEISELYNKRKVTRELKYHWNFANNDYIDNIQAKAGTNTNGVITIVDDAIATAVKAQRVASTDKWLCARGQNGQVIVANIE